MRVAIAEDSSLFREGLAALLTKLGFVVTVQARNGDELLQSIGDDPPDVALLDIRMPPTFSEEGLDVAAELRARHPGIGILVLSTYAESHYAAKLLQRGNRGVGYLLKDRVDDSATLAASIQRVADGGCVVDPDVVTDLVLHRSRSVPALERLSPRELDVMKLMAEGRSNAGIAQLYGLAAKTVEKHVAAVFTKLDLHPAADDNRRVMAVLTWLRATGGL